MDGTPQGGCVVAVVTGAGGHLGTNLVRALREQGRAVRVVDRVEPVQLVRIGAVWVQADVRDRDAMRAALDGADVVFHLAAVISVTGPLGGLVESVNVGGVRTTALAALEVGVPRFVHCSSVHAFDIRACRGSTVTENSPRATNPRLPAYDRSKAAGEAVLREVVADGLDAVVLNPTAIIGPVDPQPSRMGTLLLAAARGRLPATVAGSFDWVDVRDVVDALLAGERFGVPGANYLIGGSAAGLDTLATLAADVTGARPPLAHLPMWFAQAWSPGATALSRYIDNPLLYTAESLHAIDSCPTVDHTLAAHELGHQPRPLEETVRDLIDSFAERHLVQRRNTSGERQAAHPPRAADTGSRNRRIRRDSPLSKPARHNPANTCEPKGWSAGEGRWPVDVDGERAGA